MFTFADGLLLVAHVVLGALQSETHPALMALVLAGVAFVVGLQVLACAAGHGGGTFAHRVFIAMSQGRDREPMLIGWADTPPADRRFFLRAGVGLTTAAGLLDFGLAALQRPLGGGPRTALLSCLGKCGVAARIGALAFPAGRSLGQVSLAGEILDSKCWFGAMRPAKGKVHKACASLCIRGGIPPAFYARGSNGQGALMIMTAGGRTHGPGLLELVADPVRVSGMVRRVGDFLMLDAPLAHIRRL